MGPFAGGALPGLLLAAVGTGLFNPAGSAVALSALPDHQSGLAAGANDTFRQGGVALGIAMLGALVPAEAALGGSVEAYVEGLHTAALVAAGLAAAGAVASAQLLVRSPAPTRIAHVAEEAAAWRGRCCMLRLLRRSSGSSSLPRRACCAASTSRRPVLAGEVRSAGEPALVLRSPLRARGADRDRSGRGCAGGRVQG